MIKIAEHRVQPYGTRGITLSFPRVYANDNDVDKGSEIMIFRTVINGIDVLVLVPKKNEETFNKTNGVFQLNHQIDSYRENADVQG